MVSLRWSQLRSMFIKDQLIRKRHPIATLFELFLPILMVLVHVWTVYNKRDQQPVPGPATFRPTVHPSNDLTYYNKTFSCYSFNQNIFYTSPGSEASRIWTPDFTTCDLKTKSFDRPEEVIKTWGDQIDLRSYSANTGLFFDSLDLDNGIANFTVRGQAIDYGNPWDIPDYATYDDYLRTQSIVNILLAFHPNESSLTANDFMYHYTTKLFDEGNPIDDQSTRPRKSASTGGRSSTPTEVLDFYQSYTILELGFLYMTTFITRRIVAQSS